ncbi:MAG TPA: hypothetical protein VFZ31_09650 [Vicinamibacterales bacterium]
MWTRYRLSVFSVVFVLSAVHASAQVITNTDLPLIGNAVSNSAFAINNVGDAVGNSVHATAPINRAAVWRNHVGVELDLGCPTCNSTASDINDFGDIVGGIGPGNVPQGHGFLWRNGVTTLLPPLPGDTSAHARGINNLGVIVGQSIGPNGSRAVRWINGVPQDLGNFGANGPSFGIAEAVNDQGVIVGQTSITGTGNQAFRWENGVMSILGTLPVGTCPAISTATGINANGVIVGQSEAGSTYPDCFLKAVRWVNGVIEELPSGTLATAYDINANGDIVGITNSGPSTPQIATLWSNGQAIPLGVLPGFLFSIASDINDAGVIAARSVTQGGTVFRAYTVTVTPEDAATLAEDLLAAVTGVGPGKSLENKMRAVIDSLANGQTADACAQLQAFINEVNAQTGKKITAAQAAAFVAAALDIRAAIGC